MIYPANFEQKVGFDRLREQVAVAVYDSRRPGKVVRRTIPALRRPDVERRLGAGGRDAPSAGDGNGTFRDDEFVDVDL